MLPSCVKGDDHKRRSDENSHIVPRPVPLAKKRKTAAAADAELDEDVVSAPRPEHNKYGVCDDTHKSFTRWTVAKKLLEAANMTDEERYVHFVVPVPS